MAIETADTVWVLISSALVLLMVPGLALFYGGLVQRKNVLSSMMHSFVAMGVMALVWVLVGYSLAFGEGNWFVGSLEHAFLKGIDAYSVTGTIPTYAFVAFQGMFAIITPALISGAIVGRVKFKSYIAFIVLWGLIIYAPVCHWVWGGGFLTGEALDFAGGTVVHITAGISSLAILTYLGKRRGYGVDVLKPHNITLTLLGAGILWFGWFGFNAGSALAANEIATLAFITTIVAPAAAGFVWMVIEWYHLGYPTALGFATGVLSGLVAITPAAGFVTPIAAIPIGAIASFMCYQAVMLKNRFGYDDSLDAFGVHGVGGIIGALLTGVYASVGSEGLLLGNFSQLLVQLEGVVFTIIYASVCTLLIGFVLNRTIGLKVTESEENIGLDKTQHGEAAYNI
ncbi:MAG: ammonium transporter [Methanosarcina thermophila]|jgi:Amt family ammonium transporter|uniref:Ammonium transporter n=3 Tax=Methanosarcina thermophila TaxID=2210 RepID=A0A1I6YI60_METTE|nr:ammonium transporter [Methanosarcina thermophila]ALK05290.1 MAG: ammonia channel protein [Methanosarcina sp. 795]AKB14066.1 Ammonium transporter [Methanosarcina thermophila TM-1]AKB15290.1 Ammonium transporter [Methanosarcina thermophila CHTI-55]NLU56249.1 ammonium transporter [Methanosarcina thermophila]SFT50072.1 ammonium transporter [Methanosarcina thermophila]